MATRDIPKSLGDLTTGVIANLRSEFTFNKTQAQLVEEDFQPDSDLEEVPRETQMKNLWPAFISGAGLFSDGYVNNSIGTVSFCLKKLYPKEYAANNAISNVSSIAFAGIVVGQLGFGFISDHIARKGGMLAANVLLIVFTLLCAVGTWGAHGSPQGLFAALTTFRFFLGIAIGSEYPTASVIASEFANMLPPGQRNRWFSWFTNTMIDFGFVISAFVPWVLLEIFKTDLTAVWRLTLGLGVFPPIALFFMRLKMTDSKSFNKLHMKRVTYAQYPVWLIVKFYWFRLSVVSLIWFIYDFSAYSFGIYSTYIISRVIPDGDIYKTFGWNVVFNLFYLPGAILGAVAADYFGPRTTLVVGVGLQGIIGFIMSACYGPLKKHVGGFVVVYGIFLTLGEFGPGDNIGLLAAKTSATPIRGQYYGIAAAVGKVGAFVGTWVFPVIIKNTSRPGTDRGDTMPFYISSTLCIVSALVALFLCPSVNQNAINEEDRKFVEYLKENGFDITQLGSGVVEVVESSDGEKVVEEKNEAAEKVGVKEI